MKREINNEEAISCRRISVNAVAVPGRPCMGWSRHGSNFKDEAFDLLLKNKVDVIVAGQMMAGGMNRGTHL
jgi:hypothetical protein